jgi:putative FmdB family regulatory protein
MPTYEYLCSNCQNAWEEVQKISEPALEVCPKCAQHTARRQISGGNFILKGGGWYADLYSSTKPSGSKGEGGSASSASDTKAEASSSSKDAAPAAAATPAASTPSSTPTASSSSKD